MNDMYNSQRPLKLTSSIIQRPNLSTTFLPNLDTPTSTSTSTSSLVEKSVDFFQIKYVKAVLYIILILYASLVAPKLPNWITTFLEYSIVKIFIVFIIGLLATKDTTAAIIATIGVTITYLFISEYKDKNDIQKIYDKEKDETKKMCKPLPNEKNATAAPNVVNVEHFNTKNENTNYNVEHFDVLNNNNNNCYINHFEEHFDMLDTKENKNN